MTFKEEIAAVQARIAQARAERDGWRAAGREDKYLEACSRAQALERELDALRQRGLRASGPAESVEEPSEAERELMAELGVTFDEGRYCVGTHRYTRLEDAATYARLRRTQGRAAS